MAHLWRDWISDNPFFQLDLRRWAHRGYGWKLPLVCVGLPALLILGLHGIKFFWPRAEGLPNRELLGPVLVSVVSLIHFILLSIYGTKLFSLNSEAAAERLEFIQLLPMDHRELMVKIGFARLLLRSLVILLVVPVYLLILPYGGVPIEDIAALLLLLFALSFQPPNWLEVHGALTARRGGGVPAEAAGKTAGGAKAGSTGVFWWILIQAGFQLIGRTVIGPLLWGVWTRLAGAAGPMLKMIFPFSIVMIAARLLWLPHPFYNWILSPLWPVGVYWLIRTAGRVVYVAELWSREPRVVDQTGGRTALALPEDTGRADEQRIGRHFDTARGALMAFTAAGYAWGPLVLSGSLASLSGSATPSGGVAALLLLFAALTLAPEFERLRALPGPGPQAPRYPLRDAGAALLRSLGRTATVAMGLCLLGGASPWPEPALALALLAPAAAGALLFGAGWGARFNAPPGGKPPAVGAQWMLLLGWLATYLGPVWVFYQAGAPAWTHFACAWSPVYAFLTLFPPLGAATPVPVWAAWALPALIGAGLLSLAPRSTAPEEAAVERPPRRDALEDTIHERARVADNPLVLLEVRRQLRKPMGLLVNLVVSGAAAWLLGVGIVVGMAMLIAAERGGTAYETLVRPLGSTGWNLGSIMALVLAAGCLLFAFMALGISVSTAVTNGNVLARKQGRLAYLYITGLADDQIVRGTLYGACIAALPGTGAMLAVSLFWTVSAVALGAAWWWLLAWLWGVAAASSVIFGSALSGFDDWRYRAGWRAWLRRAAQVLAAAVLVIAISGGLVLTVRWLLDQWEAVRVLFPALLLVAVVLLAAALPFLYRRAVRAIHACRREDDLERAK